MIADFYESFKRPDPVRVLPREVIEELSGRLPRGYRYERRGDGHYVVMPDENEASVGFHGTVDREANGIPDEVAEDDLGEYLYRTQKQVKFGNVRMTDGERSLPVEDMYRDPITGESCGGVTEVWALPEPFQPSRRVVLSAGIEVSQEVDIQRRPYESMSRIKFENVTFPALSLEIIFKDKEDDESDMPVGGGSIHMSARPTRAARVHDAVVGLALVRAFGDGTLRIDGVALDDMLQKRGDTTGKLADVDSTYRSWLTLQKLEGEIGVQFDPGVECTQEDIALLRGLTCSFLDNQDVVISKPFSHFHIDLDGDWDTRELEGHIGDSGLLLSFVKEVHVSVMGASLDVYEASVLVDMVLNRITYDDDGEGAEFYVSDAPGAMFKVVKRFFRTEQAALNGMAGMYQRNTMKRQGKGGRDD